MNKLAIIAIIGGAIIAVSIMAVFGVNWAMKSKTSEIYSGSDLPDGFAVTYSYGVGEGNTLDTEREIYVHDMICKPPVNVTLQLSNDEQLRIWKAALNNDFFSISNVTAKNPIMPTYSSTLTMKANNQSHTVTFVMDPALLQNTEVVRFHNITKTIDQVLSNSEELKNLPEPPCAYQ